MCMDAQHTKHATYKLAYHFVLCPKYRKKILVGKLATFVEQEIRRICEANTWTIGVLNVQEDHVHLFLSAPPSVARSQIAHILKRRYRPPGLSMLHRSKETVMERCFLVSFVLRGQCWRYERRHSIKISRIGTGLEQRETKDGNSSFFTVDRSHDASKSPRNLIDGYDRSVSIGQLSINPLVYIHGSFRGGLLVLGQSVQ